MVVVDVVVVGGGVAGRGSPVSWRCLFGEAVIDLQSERWIRIEEVA